MSASDVEIQVLKLCCELELEQEDPVSIYTEVIERKASEIGLIGSQVHDSLIELDRSDYINGIATTKEYPHVSTVTTTGFEEYALRFIPDYEQIEGDIGFEIETNGRRGSDEIAEALGLRARIVKRVLKILEINGYVELSDEIGVVSVSKPYPELKRWLESRRTQT